MLLCYADEPVKPLLLVVGLVLSRVLSAAGSTLPAKPPAPDVFLITIDTLRADHVHCYGYANGSTPALDALAKDGVRFTSAFTPSPITNTSHASILTGLMPGSHGVTDFAVPLASAHPTIAELLKTRGYRTAAFIGAVILDSKSLAPGFDRGFDFYDNFPEHASTKSRWGRLERRGMDVVSHAENWLAKHPAGPHFVWVHLYDPHDPYEPPAPYAQTYKDRLYDGEIAYSDAALSHFIGYLKTSGKYQNSLIVVVGDHGEGLGEHREDTHGIYLYDSTTHVPLIVKLPGRESAGTSIAAQVRTVDIAPTLLDLAGAAAPEKSDGETLRVYLSGKSDVSRPIFGESDYPLRFGWAPLRCVRKDGFKFIEAPRPELYDLNRDAAELDNQYEASDSRVENSRAMLAELRARETPANASKAAPQSDTSGSVSTLPDPKDKIEEQNLLHAAMMAAEDDRPADARKALEKVLEFDPKSPTALRQLGELELQAGDYALAAQHLKNAMSIRPDDAAAALHAGEAMAKAHDPAGARDALEASLKLVPGQFQARLLLGNVYLYLKDGKAAEDQFEAALLLQSENMEAQIGLAKAHIFDRNFADAIPLLEALSKTHGKSNTEVFHLLAEAYSAVGRNREAQQAEANAKLLSANKMK
jgi:arylsulfatase A-like enzyme/Tfp pilus assembly protein PilF